MTFQGLRTAAERINTVAERNLGATRSVATLLSVRALRLLTDSARRRRSSLRAW
jgi:hypothetical protein